MTDLQARAEAAADATVPEDGDYALQRTQKALWYIARDAALCALHSEGWRPISEAEQSVGNEVLGFAIYYGKPVRFVVEWNGHSWYAGWGDAIQPTHFMLLPTPPEGETP